LPTGTPALAFGVLYGAVRFVEGFFRIDVTHGTGSTAASRQLAVADRRRARGDR
jgi:hypothetical protein